MPSRYPDRRAAGEILAAELSKVVSHANPNSLVLALPRGGVPVAHEISRVLRLNLDVFIVRKLGMPGHEELAMGAIASGGVQVLNQELIQKLQIPNSAIASVASAELAELARRNELYRAGRPPLLLQNRETILVDDGLATGSTMRAAVAAVREMQAARIIVAVPVAPQDACDLLAHEADAIVCPLRPREFHSVGDWYLDFAQTTDDEVRALLNTH